MKTLTYNLILLIFFSILGCCRGGDDDAIYTYCMLQAEIVDEAIFDATSYSNYTIQNVEIFEDCIFFVFETTLCESGEFTERLISKDAFYDVYPLKRDVKLVLTGTENCTQTRIVEASFNLEPFRLADNSPMPLNIFGWTEQMMYSY